MRIYTMTATFGKLDHQTLTLEPGLNVIEAPNEWGKSTWCAFLVSMLYGIDTREHTTRNYLAVKERYAPWSGSSMSGRIDLEWNGKNITIERSTKGRVPLGVFRAYETDTGVDVPELTAANCGLMLLGVEKSVFTRAGFLKLSDLPVTEDATLWRRLNALVTTGDESGASDTLAQKLRDLKNQCMSNRANGLIPQVLTKKDALEDKLRQLNDLQQQQVSLQQQQQELEQTQRNLMNHRDALTYEAAQQGLQQIREAEDTCAQLQAQLSQQEAQCASIPDRLVLEQTASQYNALQQESASLHGQLQSLPQPPQPTAAPALFRDLSPEEAAVRTERDCQSYAKVSADRLPAVLIITGILCLILAIAGTVFWSPVALVALLPSLVCIALAVVRSNKNKKICAELAKRYGSADPDAWKAQAAAYARQRNQYSLALEQYHSTQEQHRILQADLSQRIDQATNGAGLQQAMQQIRQQLKELDTLEQLRRDLTQSKNYADGLRKVAKPAQPPQFADTLTHSREATDRLLEECAIQHRQIADSLGRCSGRMTALGHQETLSEQLTAVNTRLEKLEKTYKALEFAQQTLASASAELQRRFAPRIAKRTQAVFATLTGNRYDRLILGDDLSLSVGAEQEDTLRSSLWRSDGTIDQLYLALRLAVAEELTPQAPLILDDALVRFDDTRLAAAMKVLRDAAQDKQVILFTCQSRENQHL